MFRSLWVLLLVAAMCCAGCPSSEPPVTESPTAGPPAPVSLYPAYGMTETSAILIWSVNEDEDFDSYAVLRSTTPELTRENATWLTELTAAREVSYQDSGLEPATTYYYRVLVTDTEELTSLSNEVAATTLSRPAPEPPRSVVLFPASEVTHEAATLLWSMSTEEDFTSYTLLRGDSPGVTRGNGLSVTVIDEAATPSYRDGGLDAEAEYYYRVMVTDEDGLSSLSNEVEVVTEAEPIPEPPSAASLYPPYNAATDSLYLTWTVNNDSDFLAYTLLRADEPIADETVGDVVVEIEDRLSVTLQDTGLSPGTEYHYRLVTEDTEGEIALSNQVAGWTLPLDEPASPRPVVLGPVYDVSHDTLTLSWTQSQDESFGRYELHRSDEAGVALEDTLVFTADEPSETRHVDRALEVYTQYFYRIWVFNQVGSSVPSNEVSGRTTYDAAPAAVTLQDPTDIDSTGMTLAWEMSDAGDFAVYRLYRSTAPAIDQTATLIYETADPEVAQFVDDGLEPNRTYYYRLYVVDTWGIGTGSNTVHATTLNTLAPRCTIRRSHTWLPVGALFTLDAVDCQDDLTSAADIQVRWLFGDGSAWTAYSTVKTTTHAYAARGAYWVVLEVSDGLYTSTSMAVVATDEMVPIDAGTFNMGRSAGTTPWPSMEPARSVQMSAFHIDTYEVANSQYAAFLSDGNSEHYWVSQDIADNHDGTYSAVLGLEDRPATGVSWFDAVAFCQWAGKSLPTEARWEYAARGPSGGPNSWYPWGNALPMSLNPVPANFANLVGHAVDVTSYPEGVTRYSESKVIWQLSGNADEWVHDYYWADYYQWANDHDDNTDPTGPATTSYPVDEPAYRVTRGGSFSNDENPLRVSFRCFADPYSRSNARGFRCATGTLP